MDNSREDKTFESFYTVPWGSLKVGDIIQVGNPGCQVVKREFVAFYNHKFIATGEFGPSQYTYAYPDMTFADYPWPDLKPGDAVECIDCDTDTPITGEYVGYLHNAFFVIFPCSHGQAAFKMSLARPAPTVVMEE